MNQESLQQPSIGQAPQPGPVHSGGLQPTSGVTNSNQSTANSAAPSSGYSDNPGLADKSNLQSIYPQVSDPTQPKAPISQPSYEENQYKDASTAFAESLTLILGIASATSYILILYLVKNTWATAIVSALLAFAAMYFAIKEYRNSRQVSPFTVIGLSAATITLVYIGNFLMTLAVIHSALSY